MQFVVSSSELLKRISAISKIIVSNPVIPIIENFLFAIDYKDLTITSSDLQTYFVTRLDVESEGSASVAIPAKILLETLKGLPDQPVTFKIDEESYGIEIISSNGKYKLVGESPQDFPDVPDVDTDSFVEVPSSILKKGVQKTLFATSNDDIRPATGGVFFKLDHDGLTLVTTDSHKLAKYSNSLVYPGKENIGSVILPKKPLSILSGLSLLDKVENANVFLTGSYVCFDLGDTDVISRIIDEVYPDYENVLPNENPYKMEIDREDLLRSIKRVALYANKVDNEIRFRISGDDLEIITWDTDFMNAANEKMKCMYHGEKFEIGFNAKYLIEVLSNISSEEVQFLMGVQPTRAVLVLPKTQDDSEDLTSLVMPVALKEVDESLILEDTSVQV